MLTRNLFRLLLVFLFSGLGQVSLADDLVLTSPPRESPQAGLELYGPLAEQLSKEIGRRVVYRHPGNWLRYQRDMRRNVYDIVFDGPHFASWRMKYYDHTPIAKLPEQLQFYLVSKSDNVSVTTPRDLAARRVCVIPPPNLASLLLLTRMDGPASEPVIEPSKNMKEVYADLVKNKCEAAMMRSSYYDKKLTEQQRSELKVIYRSPYLPNQVITLSHRFSENEKAVITQSILYGNASKVSKNIFRRFAGKQVKAFLPVRESEFHHHSELLENVILGWKKDVNETMNAMSVNEKTVDNTRGL